MKTGIFLTTLNCFYRRRGLLKVSSERRSGIIFYHVLITFRFIFLTHGLANENYKPSIWSIPDSHKENISFRNLRCAATMHTPGPEQDDSFDFLFKIILIGDSNVGKTCMVQNFKSGTFSDKQQNTIGVDFSVRTVDIEGKKVKVSDERHLRIQ